MKPTFFISDAHLGSQGGISDKERIGKLSTFLDYVAENGSRLYILGDLFDFWFEYKYVIPRQYFSVILKIKQLADRGLQLGYIVGNHDFWVDGFFSGDLGIPVYPDFLDVTIGGMRLFIAHGDGLAKKDRGYRLLKKFLRHPFSIASYRLLHPDIGFSIAHFCSKISRDHKVIDDDDKDYLEFAKTKFDEGFDAVVLGHTHRPEKHTEPDHTYVNSGNFMTHFTYAVLDNGELNLLVWK